MLDPNPTESIKLSEDQERVLDALYDSPDNVFVTGAAGTGKSFVIREFLKDQNPKVFPVLASTGAAAVLVGGRTFHSFFGLGIMEGGVERTIERAMNDKRLLRRLKKTEGVIIDEVSMLSAETLVAAETISRFAREELNKPWGGLRVIAVGDFAQLPPVEKGYGSRRSWAFEHNIWRHSGFKCYLLSENKRIRENAFLSVLHKVRLGQMDDDVEDFLNNKRIEDFWDDDATVLMPRKNQVASYNNKKLNDLETELHRLETLYAGKANFVKRMKLQAPVPETLEIKVGALIMFRVNDPKQRWVNGTKGNVIEVGDDYLLVNIEGRGPTKVEVMTFTMLDAEGEVVATATNYPVQLAYAATIHKAQGLTLEKVLVDLKGLWEPGQAYVALSRVREPSGLLIKDWTPQSIIADKSVLRFYESMDAGYEIIEDGLW